MRLAADGAPTLAELLGAEGYTTLGVCCNDLVSPATGLTRGFATFIEERDALPGGIDHTLAERAAGRLGPLRRRLQARHLARRRARDHGGERATRLLERALRTVPRDRPLHLFVNYLESHLPYSPSDTHALPYLPGGALAQARAVNQLPLDHVTGAARHGEQDWALLRGLYRGAVHYVDELVGRVLAMLRAAGRLDNALLVVTSDHGENIGDHDLMDHQCSLHETVLRVPLLLRLPGAAQRGRRDDLAQLTDIVPTVCEVAGVAAPPTQGESLLLPLQRSHAIAEYLAPHVILEQLRRTRPDVDLTPWDRGLRSIRTATRKYVAATDGRNEFYDLAADPWELDNRFGEHPDELAMARALRRWEHSNRAADLSGDRVDAEITERLSALGYID
jgi:arylsulfatase A-like enzyme